jgi:hypothetical protein
MLLQLVREALDVSASDFDNVRRERISFQIVNEEANVVAVAPHRSLALVSGAKRAPEGTVERRDLSGRWSEHA